MWVLRERGIRTFTWDVSPESFSGMEPAPEQLRDIVDEPADPAPSHISG